MAWQSLHIAVAQQRILCKLTNFYHPVPTPHPKICLICIRIIKATAMTIYLFLSEKSHGGALWKNCSELVHNRHMETPIMESKL